MEDTNFMNLPVDVDPEDVEKDIRHEYEENPDIKRLSRRYCKTAAEIRKILKKN